MRLTIPARFVALAALLLVSAEPNPAGLRELHQGHAAFARKDYAAAIVHFDRAQPLLADSGLAAFNRAAAHYRLGQYDAAALDYRRTLDDAAIPAERRQRAWYDLGNSLLQRAGESDREAIEGAIAAYKECLDAVADDALRKNAEHNLSVAVRRLQKILPKEPPKGDGPNPKADPKESKDPGNKSDGKSKSVDPKDRKGNDPTQQANVNDPGSKNAATGLIGVLPDRSTPAGALAAEVERIAAERRRNAQSRDVLPLRGKDW